LGDPNVAVFYPNYYEKYRIYNSNT
jgi:hypothetical protein